MVKHKTIYRHKQLKIKLTFMSIKYCIMEFLSLKHIFYLKIPFNTAKKIKFPRK